MIILSCVGKNKVCKGLIDTITKNKEFIEEKIREIRTETEGEYWYDFQELNIDINFPENLSDNTFTIYPVIETERGRETDTFNFAVVQV